MVITRSTRTLQRYRPRELISNSSAEDYTPQRVLIRKAGNQSSILMVWYCCSKRFLDEALSQTESMLIATVIDYYPTKSGT